MKLNAYELAKIAGVYTPDTLDAAGAEFLVNIYESWKDGYNCTKDYDLLTEIADNCVPVYTHELWCAFVDLGAYNEDLDEFGFDSIDTTEAAARVALFQIARRLLEYISDGVENE